MEGIQVGISGKDGIDMPNSTTTVIQQIGIGGGENRIQKPLFTLNTTVDNHHFGGATGLSRHRRQRNAPGTIGGRWSRYPCAGSLHTTHSSTLLSARPSNTTPCLSPREAPQPHDRRETPGVL